MTEKEDQLVGKDKSHPEELLLFMSLPTIKHPEGLVVRNQLPKSAIIVLVYMRFGSVRVLEVNLMKNDCELSS